MKFEIGYNSNEIYTLTQTYFLKYKNQVIMFED